jgi:cell division protein FtsB
MENGIASMSELYEKISAMNSDYYTLRGEIVSAERQIAKLNERLSMLEQFSENKAIHKRLSNIKTEYAGYLLREAPRRTDPVRCRR